MIYSGEKLVFPARAGVIFGWEYYPFPPNFPTQLVFPTRAGVIPSRCSRQIYREVILAHAGDPIRRAVHYLHRNTT
nr:MAG TPA: hypothetical protein [Caudoviricetes sp.]